ncbi:MAG: prepilin-type N-terminal cleavage/methylation domain-containing protein [Planctomycetes bacterium]|nr:prepilin-type N-terminal cleavage/methylation domain-containing protein [Planctomycetota bacterium]
MPRGASPATKWSCGFTLIELLVVVAIIALLIAILIPSLAQARELAKRTLCAANQRQLAVTFYTYANDSKGVLPDTWPNTGGRNHMLWVWSRKVTDDLLHRYLGGPDIAKVDTLAEAPQIGEAFRVFMCPTQDQYHDNTYFAFGPGVTDLTDNTRWTGFVSLTSSELSASTFAPSTSVLKGKDVRIRTLADKRNGPLFTEALYHTTDYDTTYYGGRWTWLWSLMPSTQQSSYSWHIGNLDTTNGYSVAGANQTGLDGSVTWYNFGDIVEGAVSRTDVMNRAQVYQTFGATMRGYYWYQPGRKRN